MGAGWWAWTEAQAHGNDLVVDFVEPLGVADIRDFDYHFKALGLERYIGPTAEAEVIAYESEATGQIEHVAKRYHCQSGQQYRVLWDSKLGQGPRIIHELRDLTYEYGRFIHRYK